MCVAIQTINMLERKRRGTSNLQTKPTKAFHLYVCNKIESNRLNINNYFCRKNKPTFFQFRTFSQLKLFSCPYRDNSAVNGNVIIYALLLQFRVSGITSEVDQETSDSLNMTKIIFECFWGPFRSLEFLSFKFDLISAMFVRFSSTLYRNER